MNYTIVIDNFPTHAEIGKKIKKKIRINGQHLYNAKWNFRLRSEIVKSLKRTFSQLIFKYKRELRGKIKKPVIISYEFHIPKDYMQWEYNQVGWIKRKKGGENFDIGNLSWIYCKIIDDVLVDQGIIEGDSLEFVVGTNGSLFIEEPDIKKRKIVVNIKEV